MPNKFSFVYIVVYQSVTDPSDKVSLVFQGNFSQVVKDAKHNCFDGYFTLEIKVA